MIWWAGLLLVTLTACARPAAPFYYCAEVELRFPTGRTLNALECLPRAERIPGPDPFDPRR